MPFRDFVVQRALAADENPTVQPPKIEVNPANLQTNDKLGLIAILVEDSLMNDFDVRGRIMTYADSAQQRIPHSKSFVLEVGKNESTFRIASMLEKMYFEGIDTDLIDGNPLNNNSSKEDNNQLIGIVLIGNVPIPVVHEEGGVAAPSLYPYTDFYRKKYIYNHASDQFEVNSEVSAPSPEIWHGLIVPPSKDPATAKEQLIEYLNKNYEFTVGNPDYADFEKRVLYANYPEMESQMNFLDYRNYIRYLKYMEEMVMSRFNKHLLKEVVKEVSADMGSLDSPIMDDASINAMFDVHAESIIKNYAVNLAKALKIYRSGINESIKKTGRWTAAEVDSPESLITLRDEYAKSQIKRNQLLLEKDVNDFVSNNVNAATRKADIVTQAELNVKLVMLDLEADSNTFTFYGFFDGQRANDILQSKQCGIQVGQKRGENESVLENNSVLVKANRMYDPASLITPPDDEDWVMEDDGTYKAYGGCVFNNSMSIPETGNNPGKCNPATALLSIYDIVGSIESESGQGSPCDVGNMNFRLMDDLLYESTAAENIIPPVLINESLTSVITQAYLDLQSGNPILDPVSMGSYVVKNLMASGQTYSYELLPGTNIELSVTAQGKQVDTLSSHVEPTNETIKAIKHIGEPRIDPVTGKVKFPQITTPSTPADGIRYLSFAKNGIMQIYKYLNLFRIKGNNPGAITGDLFNKIKQKQDELNVATSVESSVLQDFFVENSQVIEPIIWRAESIDQKLADIIPKYTNRDSFMPTPYYNPRKSPQNKPDGYEVLHIVADGDAQGYQFGLNRAMLAKGSGTEAKEEDTGTEGGGGGGGEGGGGGGGGGTEEEENNDEYICGDPKGVEIWEWFESLQCWIEKEIMPAEELFALSQSCSAAPIPPEEEETPEDPFASIIMTATDFNVEMNRKSLVPGQTEKIKISAMDDQGKPVLGYIDMPIHIELSNPDLGSFSANDVYIFTGEREVEFTANKTGTGTVTVTMGDLPERTFTISVYDKIELKWSAAEEIKGGRSEFTLRIGIKAPDGSNITNITDGLLLAPEQPADGGFENNGTMQLTNGNGELKFYPTPGKKSITLISKDKEPGINGPSYVIHPTGGSASQIILRPPSYIPIGKEVEIEVLAADSFGFPANDFNKAINVQLDEKSKEFATLTSPTVSLTKGKGTIKIKGGRETGDIKLMAEYSGLKKGVAQIPLLARVDSETWKNTYPQTLFASFVGFPAGDFTQENYFGGTHLFAGKTEAVYSFLNAPAPAASLIIAPNHLITTTGQSQTVYVEFPGNQMLLQAFDQKTMQTLISKKVNLNFDAVEKYEGKAPAVGHMMVEVLDTDYVAIKNQQGYDVKNLRDEVIVNLQPNKVRVMDSNYKLVYEPQPEFNAIELKLTDGSVVAARILMSLKPESIKPENFQEISPSLRGNTIYGGKSTNDPTGLAFSDVSATVPEAVREEFYGFEGQQKYISLFSSGTNIGDAVKFNMPINAILLGDPTIRLQTKSLSGLNYNSATGQQIYQDPEGKQIVSINHFNFNNDGHEDVALLMEDGRVRLLEGGATEPPYKDKGNIAFLVDEGVALETLDLKKDNYEDLLIATNEGRFAILNNDHEVITRTDHKLNIGKKMYKILKDDMNQDGYADLVILDSRGDIYIFYYNPATKSFPENGQWIANYGYSLKLNDNLNTDLDIRYAGMPEPEQPGEEPGNTVATGTKPPLEGYELGGTVDEGASLAFIQSLAQANKEAAKNPTAAAKKTAEETPKLPWPEGDATETYFAPIESIGALNVIKKVANKDRPGVKNVDLEETLTYTIEINSGVTLNNVVVADTVPDALSFMPKSVTCVEGDCVNVKAIQNSVKVFFSGLNIKPGKKIVISYDAFVAHTPSAFMMVQKINEPNENLANPASIIDVYPDILVSPPYNTTGQLLMHYSIGPKNYAVTQSNAPEPKTSTKPLSDYGNLMQQMSVYENGNFDEDNPPPEPTMGASFANALDEATGNNDCFEDPESAVSCTEEVLDDIASAIADFSCMGGGCFPMPYNYAFLTPSDFPLPALAFPTTMPTAVGPIPMVSGFGIPSVLGMASITGPIMSQLRIYMSPTLTGGIGIALCWGPYPTSPTVPPPVWPIPYPPPIGNCMVIALPVDDMYGGLCSLVEEGITAVMDLIASGVDKINSTVNDWNNDPNIPFSIEQGGSGQGAGGMEIGLGVNLGNSMKFEPPAKAFSNTHIPTFDSLGGVISGWFDRQVLEIKNKLLTLPTFTIFLPDFKSLWSLDVEKTIKRFDQWKNTMSGSGAETLESLDTIAADTSISDTEKALQYTKAVEAQASVYNINALQGLYDVASSLPLVKLTEKPILFEVPWLSAAEIQAWIMQAQNWVLYYEREYNRVKDVWEKITCDDLPDTSEGGSASENAANCIARSVADAFGVNLDPMIKSVKDNIDVLQSYLNFPKQLVKFKQQLAGYIQSVACYINVIATMMGGWMATIQQQMISWAEMILTIVEIIDNIKDLFDLFVNFDTDCDICTNERWANFGWWMLLGLILPDIPIITFPKIPDIVLDLSDFNAVLNIELPILELRTKPIPLPPLPYIRLPDFPTVNLLLTLPPLPVLPKLPALPDLPALPPLPTIDLPTLPAPPKLPDVGAAFELVIPIIEKILDIWCIMKKSFAPVPEMMLNDQITLLTNRPAYLIPLDILKIQLPNIALFDLGFNQIRIETVIYLGLRLNVVSQPLEDLAKTWNGWIAEIPKKMNEGYKIWLDASEKFVQEEIIDPVDAKMAEWAKNFEEGCIEYNADGECTKTMQDVIDEEIGDPMAEADQWLRDKEAEWQAWADEQKIDWTYEDYYNAINSTYEKIRKIQNEEVKQWFEENMDWIHALNYLTPLAAIFEIANEENLGDKVQEALDFIAEKLNESLIYGPTYIERLYICISVYEYCRAHEDEFFQIPQSNAAVDPERPKENKMIARAPEPEAMTPQMTEEEYARQMLETPQGQQIKTLINQMAQVMKDVNERPMVDYTVLKEQLGVPDYEFAPRETTVDKLKLLEDQLNKHSEKLLAEAEGLKNVRDLNAIAGVAPLSTQPYQLADSSVTTTDLEEKVFTSALPRKELAQNNSDPVSRGFMELQGTVDRTAGQSTPAEEASAGGLEGSCKAAVCLPDPVTKSPVPVIPYISLIATSETLFMPNGHLIYDDGTGLFLKRDLTIDDSNENTNVGNPRRFEFNEMSDMLGMAENPKEAVNMLQSTFTENGASTFTWLPSTHPDVYGYGIELERIISGYDPEKQNNPLPDTKILLLPPDGEGFPPEATAGGQKIEFGTLVTSLESKEEAAAKFGVNPRNIVTGAKDIRFPTINNALIKLSENKAVYFDQLGGSAYSMNMENGYYQIKMTWFDQKADTATYNKNEILAPQVYSTSGEPIDVSQTDTYYMPIFKEKKIKASEIFVDLAGVYKYYWFINPESNRLTPQVGDTLTITPQKEAKKFKVKLVATQDISDESFKTYEKTFEVVVYVPTITLDSDSMNKGIVAGNMSPIPQAKDDNLSDIPFSVFRKRMGTWKNVGSSSTKPPLGKEESYHSIDSNGSYYIEGLSILNPSPMVLKDNEGNVIAEVAPDTGLINLKDPNFDLIAVPGGTDSPTHIAIIKKDTREILGNIFYLAANTSNVTIVDSPLTTNNVMSTGVTVGDTNSGDDIVAANIPKEGPSFPGGVAIFEKTPQTNVALVDTDGTIRMMQAGYELKIKNRGADNGRYIFEIVNDKGNALFDVHIQADFKNLQVSDAGGMDSLKTQIGWLPKTETAFAPSIPKTSTETQSPPTESPPVPKFEFKPEAPLEVTGDPFTDVDKTNPYYQQILDLYKSRVVTGYEDGSFKPDQKLTRAEFIKIALGVTNCFDCTTPTEPQKERYSENPFPDVSLPSWYYYCIAIAKELGMVTGYGDGFFRPDRYISRAEAAAVLLRQSKIELMETPLKAFTDVPDYAWYVEEVYTAVQIGLIKANFGLVNPDEPITRGEFAFMAAGVKNIKDCYLVDTDGDGVPDWWEMTHGMDMLVPDAERFCPCADSPWKADTDGDGKRDVCDIDIDNDGVLNPMCALTDTGEMKGEPGDNCLFVANKDQADSNGNGIGDACDKEGGLVTPVTCPCADNPNQTDTDKDGIRDVCDDDIDNDGIKQPICIFDDSGLIDPTKLTEGDNCVFLANPDQKDEDKSGKGDLCELEATDICPDVPEDLDGVDDEDGCPDLTDAFPDKEPGVYVTPGELCSFVDYATDIKDKDIFMTAITDLETHEVLFSKSGEVTYSK